MTTKADVGVIELQAKECQRLPGKVVLDVKNLPANAGDRDALKKDSRGLCRGAAGNPRVPRLLPGTLGNFPGCL